MAFLGEIISPETDQGSRPPPLPGEEINDRPAVSGPSLKGRSVTSGARFLRTHLQRVQVTRGITRAPQSSTMRGFPILLLTLALAQALHRGRDYEKEKVCREFASLGKDDFRSLSIVMHSKKYPRASFSEVIALVNEVVSLTETCCAQGADPDCYDEGASALSAKSCEKDSPFPRHPDVAECCAKGGLERKLCMAALMQPPQEFPTYVEPSNDETCEAFKKDPKGFAEQFLYEYSSNYGQAPLRLLLGYTKSYLSMVGTCCFSPKPNTCFLHEKLQSKQISVLTTMSNSMCSRYAAYGKKFKYSSMLKIAQKVPSADFKDAEFLSEDSIRMLSKCCDSDAEDCMSKELPEHVEKVCDRLSTKDSQIQSCCQENTPMDIVLCLYSKPPAKSPKPADLPRPTNEDMCGTENPKALDRYIFEIGRRYAHVPEVFLSKILDGITRAVSGCCSGEDPHTCLGVVRSQMKREMVVYLAKAKELCGDYSELTFTEYKKGLTEKFSQKQPDASPATIKELVERRATFASSCCISNAPPRYCSTQIDIEVGHTCEKETCLLL
ncbi:vitamin D-binding protein isoform X2 [Ornithorhynchus anatinus]|nr:vitamin D-binding protein isoform X2 [Ornithorhynchus anatinus]